MLDYGKEGEKLMPNIKLGPCKATFHTTPETVIDKTIGGVDFEAVPIYHEIKVDQFGQGNYDKRIVGWDVKAVIRMAESTYDNIKAMSAGLVEVEESPTKKKLHDAQLGTSMRAGGKKLVLHPLENDPADVSDDVVIYLAAPDTPLDLKYNYENERVLEVTMVGYPRDGVDPGDENAYFCIGDETAVDTPSTEADLLDSIYGTLDGPPVTEVSGVLVGLKVRDFKNGLTVSDYATVEILDGTGGAPVTNQETTDVTDVMVIQVTAQDGLVVEEYTIAMAP